MFDLTDFGAGAGGITTAILLLPFFVIAVANDLLDRRIPNVVVGMMLVCGASVQVAAYADVSAGLLLSLSGAVVGLIILLPFYVLGGMGAGDVKLLAAAGTFLGPQTTMLAGLFTLAAGAILGLAVLAYQYFRAQAATDQPSTNPVKERPQIQLPYSLAIATGTLLAVMQW